MRVVRTIVGAALLAVGVALPAGTGHAQALSTGCTALNDPFLDGISLGGAVDEAQFFAGETASFRVGPPLGQGPAPTETELDVNGGVAATGFPATLNYEVPADGVYTIQWRVNVETEATWSVSCGPPGIGSSDGGELADTGPASSTIALVAGILFVAAGSSLFLVSRMRRGTSA